MSKVIGSKLESALLRFTSKIETVQTSRASTHVVCYSGIKTDGCMTFLRRTDKGFTLAVLGPLAELAKRCDRMLHKGNVVPFNPELVEQAAGQDEAYAVVYEDYDSSRFTVKDFEVSFEDLPQTQLVMAGFFTVEPQTHTTNFAILKTLCHDFQVKVVVHSDLTSKKTVQILKKLGLAADPVSSELDLPFEEALNLSTTAIMNGGWLHSALESGSAGKVKRVLAKPYVAICEARPIDHSAVIKILQDIGYSVVALCTREEDNEDLKRADFSVSFALSGHESCRFSTDLVLVDDNLSQLVRAKGMAEGQETSIAKIQLSICGLYLPTVACIGLATLLDFHLSSILIFCTEIGSVMIPVFSLGFGQSQRFYTFSPLQTWFLVVSASVFTFAFALGDYGYFGDECLYPEGCLKADAFYYAQSAFFISVIMAQWTASVLLYIDDAWNGAPHLHWSSVQMCSIFKLIIGLLICFIPQFNIPLYTRPTRFLHFGFPAVLFFVAVFLLEVVRCKVFKKN